MLTYSADPSARLEQVFRWARIPAEALPAGAQSFPYPILSVGEPQEICVALGELFVVADAPEPVKMCVCMCSDPT